MFHVKRVYKDFAGLEISTFHVKRELSENWAFHVKQAVRANWPFHVKHNGKLAF